MSSARSNGLRPSATLTATATSNTCARLRRDSPTRAGKIRSDSISHADGLLARPPIALCCVQGYVYAATTVAEVAARLESQCGRVARLSDRAELLKAAFTRDFWLDDDRTVGAGARRGQKPCRVMASNAAHCLATGLLDRDQEEALAERLMADDMFSGWGVRTLSATARRYNPMSYHNGSNRFRQRHRALVWKDAGRAGFLKHRCGADPVPTTGGLPGTVFAACAAVAAASASRPLLLTAAWAAAKVMMMLQAIRSRSTRLTPVIESPVLPEGMALIGGSG